MGLEREAVLSKRRKKRIERVAAATLSIKVGSEKEFIGYRLADIIFLATETKPVDGDWEGYAKQCLRIIADQATKARTILSVMAE